MFKEIRDELNLGLNDNGLLHSTVFEDNNGALALATAPKLTLRNKHIAVKYHFFKEHIGEEKGIQIVKIENKFQKADIFTKSLPMVDFERV